MGRGAFVGILMTFNLLGYKIWITGSRSNISRFSISHAYDNSKWHNLISVQNPIPRIAVVLHLGNLDLWPQYWTFLKQLLFTTSFFVSTTLDKKIEVQELVQKDIVRAQFYAFENRGHDFGALISLLKLVPIHEFDLIP